MFFQYLIHQRVRRKESNSKAAAQVVPFTTEKLARKRNENCWLGGNADPFVYFGTSEPPPDVLEDMTAVAIVSTKNGCIVAADGRSLDAADLVNRANDYQQKIFNARWEQSDFIYALTGSIFSKKKSFDLIAEAEDAIQSLSAMHILDSSSYIHQFAAKIMDAFERGKKEGRCPSFNETPDGTIVRIFLLGYFGATRATLAVLRYHHHNQALLPFEFTIERPAPTRFTGSQLVANAITDGRLGKYKADIPFDSSLAEGEKCAKGFIEAHSDPLARGLDPVVCEGIGGHTHIAEITPAGFKWRIEPKK
jgi:hypothetical protein